MPFTPSHAVIALPFVRTRLVPAAIAVGAMTPDLALFTRGFPLPYGRTHDVLWLPATVGVALALLLVWRCALRPAVRELSPAWLAQRLPTSWDHGARAGVGETFAGVARGSAVKDRPRASVSAVALLIASLALGVVSHIVWDLFTHEGRWGVQWIPALDLMWGPLSGYKWLQHASSFIGLAIIGVWGIVWVSRRRTDGPVPRIVPNALRWVWWLSLPVALATGWVIGLATWGPLTSTFTAAHLAYRVLPITCAWWAVATLVLAVAIQIARRRRETS
ncbi:DUF4184 family protein [Microbacterium sp. SLBN-146]|uniref:DUF4184 family protein n=1 Tax=Microbacterium sp. SLBN-146 TaxID=2768457 RepID=UPI00114FB12F|nr:DUF4184 family protein [Microbacterium sp. SLBN-146]TQJ32437.1 uncharacterized protein DUF4184 [Microbacterium sp. SLBN-146]